MFERIVKKKDDIIKGVFFLLAWTLVCFYVAYPGFIIIGLMASYHFSFVQAYFCMVIAFPLFSYYIWRLVRWLTS